MKVVSGIKESHQVTSSRVLTISMSRDAYVGERLQDDRVFLLFYFYVVPYTISNLMDSMHLIAFISSISLLIINMSSTYKQTITS